LTNLRKENRPSEIVGGLAETWAMAEAKRARIVETPKQPSFSLRLRASHFYPDHLKRRDTLGCFAHCEANQIRIK